MRDQALSLINEARVATLKRPLTELPKGRPGDPCNCVVAKALDVSTGLGTFRVPYNETWRAAAISRAWGTPYTPGSTNGRLPLELQRFVAHFDTLQYPELIDDLDA